jgi:hypothetical protein
MKRLRALAAVLGCLAVLAGGFMTVAAAAVPLSPPVTERDTTSAPCSHCDDCDGVPCPMPTTTCVQMSSTVAPTLATATFELPAVGFGMVRWSLLTTSLSGLSPPPDPLPPRA